MSVSHAFEVGTARYSEQDKRLYMTDGATHRITFDFDLFCKAGLINAAYFFNFKSKKCIIVARFGSKFRCLKTDFWVSSVDYPVLAVHNIEFQDKGLAAIAEEFRHKYAAYLLDKVINS